LVLIIFKSININTKNINIIHKNSKNNPLLPISYAANLIVSSEGRIKNSPNWDRTSDIEVNSFALYLLSYQRMDDVGLAPTKSKDK